MWTHTYSQRTGSSVDEVWSVLADIAGWGRWNDGIETIVVDRPETADPAEPIRVGTTFRMTPPGEDTILSTVVALEAPHLLTDLTQMDGIDVRVEHRVDAEADGSLISFAVTVTGGAPDSVLEEIGRAVSADFPEVIAGLADFTRKGGAE